ncbi:hypothetical protein PanWU01x14_297280 [Parasponia andersonii]|uniref:Uncharacterized protein n=1 Tax=Parasponia andersonii TaxID=3476 RepID=A0A2P5AVB7_PARAD|nr:hypothetical protein PanWU01x14_297280 [Parasponia andersonii]
MEILYLYVPSGQGMFSILHVHFNSLIRTFLKNIIQPKEDVMEFVRIILAEVTILISSRSL